MFESEFVITNLMWKDYPLYKLSMEFEKVLQKEVKKFSKDLINGDLFALCFKYLKKSMPNIEQEFCDFEN